LEFKIPQSYKAAIAEQRKLAQNVYIEDEEILLKIVAGVDVAYSRRGKEAWAIAGIVTMEWETFQPIEFVHAICPVSFPYLTGLLSYRELPVLIKALNKLQSAPDLWMFDGAGIAHPRKIGLASHFGVLTNSVTIGVAKSRLVGEYEEPAIEKGSVSPLYFNSEQVGVVLRSRRAVKPLFISPGHRISIEKAALLVLKACVRYRLPEPTRAAHCYVTEVRRKFVERGVEA
jgi:deoxyribonuclease V